MSQGGSSGRRFSVLLAMAVLVLAQRPKSRPEAEALMAIMNEQDPTKKIAKVDAFVANFADTEFKAWAYSQAASAALGQDDGAKLILYGELAIESDPKAYQPMLMVAGELARSTRENDLDKEEKLSRAEKYALRAIEILSDVPKPNSQIPDDQWDGIKKDFLAAAHRDLGMIASARKKYDDAAAEFKKTGNLTDETDGPTLVREAAAYNDAGKPDDALAALAKVCDPFLELLVERERNRALRLKSAKGETPPPAPLASPCGKPTETSQGGVSPIRSEIARIERGPHSVMPAPTVSPLPSGTVSGAIQRFVENRTEYTLAVLFSGPAEREIILAPGGTEELSLPPGTYRVAARVPVSTRVLPFFGVQSYPAGQRYSSHFYITTR